MKSAFRSNYSISTQDKKKQTGLICTASFFFFFFLFNFDAFFFHTAGFPPAFGVCWLVSRMYYQAIKIPVTGIGFLGNCTGQLPHRALPQWGPWHQLYVSEYKWPQGPCLWGDWVMSRQPGCWESCGFQFKEGFPLR